MPASLCSRSLEKEKSSWPPFCRQSSRRPPTVYLIIGKAMLEPWNMAAADCSKLAIELLEAAIPITKRHKLATMWESNGFQANH